jgi:hypothetical protein
MNAASIMWFISEKSGRPAVANHCALLVGVPYSPRNILAYFTEDNTQAWLMPLSILLGDELHCLLHVDTIL